jgi:hypothetical protein
LEVDDISFGGPGGGPGAGNPTGGSLPQGGLPGQNDGSVPPGGFDGPPPNAAGGPGGNGFDPTTRLIEQLGLDATDPAVAAALEKCQPIITDAFQPTTTGA